MCHCAREQILENKVLGFARCVVVSGFAHCRTCTFTPVGEDQGEVKFEDKAGDEDESPAVPETKDQAVESPAKEGTAQAPAGDSKPKDDAAAEKPAEGKPQNAAPAPQSPAPSADSPPVDNTAAAEKKAYPSFFGQDEPGKAQASDPAADSKPAEAAAADKTADSPKAEKAAESPKEEKPAPEGFFGQAEPKTNGAAASSPAPAAEKSAAVAQKLASKKGASADTVSDDDFKTLTVKDLKIQLKARGLPVSGLKAELIIRLIGESDKAAAE